MDIKIVARVELEADLGESSTDFIEITDVDLEKLAKEKAVKKGFKPAKYARAEGFYPEIIKVNIGGY